jgi:O-antigen/teichoic acid export membrane protein
MPILSRLFLEKSHHVVYVIASGVGGFINLCISVFLGRVLSLEEFALINFVNGILICTTTVSGAFGTTVSYKTGYLIGRFGASSAYLFWKKVRFTVLFCALFFTLVWLAATPFTSSYFHIYSIIPLMLCGLIIVSSFVYSADRGMLSSRFKFFHLAVLAVFEPVLKFIGMLILILLGLHYWTFAFIPISFFISFLLGRHFVKNNIKKFSKIEKISLPFPKTLFSVILFSSVSQVILLSLDVILAKHYLSSLDAGLYGLISVVTKILFFAGSLIIPLITPFVSRYEGNNRDTSQILTKVFWATLLILIPFFVVFGLFSFFTIPLLFGNKALIIVPYLPLTTFAMSCFVLGKIISDYYILKKYYIFPFFFFIVGLSQMLFLSFSTINLKLFIYIISSGWIISAIIIFVLHVSITYSKRLRESLIFSKIPLRRLPYEQ